MEIMKKMTCSNEAKAHGFRNLKALSVLLDIPVRTLQGRHKDNRDLWLADLERAIKIKEGK